MISRVNRFDKIYANCRCLTLDRAHLNACCVKTDLGAPGSSDNGDDAVPCPTMIANT